MICVIFGKPPRTLNRLLPVADRSLFAVAEPTSVAPGIVIERAPEVKWVYRPVTVIWTFWSP